MANTVTFTHAKGEAFLMHVIDIWKSGNLAGFEEVYSPKASGHFELTHPITYEDIKNRFIYVSQWNENRNFAVQKIMIEDNYAMIFFLYTAYDTKLNKKIEAPTIWLFTIQQSQIVNVDILTSLQLNYEAAF